MTRFDPDPQALSTLKDKVVVLTGGSTGIGAATVKLLHHAGATVVFGDLNTSAAESLVSSLSASSAPSTPTPIFVPCDVAKYSDNVRLFKTALDTYGRVDHAVANAGLTERPGWFEPSMSLEDVETEPDTSVLDVNLKAVLYFARIACAYLAHEKPKGSDRSLTLLSSVAGFKETPGLFVYQASKHGVLGLMRSLRLYTPKTYGVRVNAVCPWMTLTGMVTGVAEAWQKAGLPANTPEDVAKIVGGLAAAGPGPGIRTLRSEKSEGESGKGLEGAYNASGNAWGEQESSQGVNGRAICVEGGRGWDIEEGLSYTQSFWLGKGFSERLVEGQKVLGLGSDWSK